MATLAPERDARRKCEIGFADIGERFVSHFALPMPGRMLPDIDVGSSGRAASCWEVVGSVNDLVEAGDRPERETRKNLMLAAAVESHGASYPVRIRNISASGAMIEGGTLPPIGAHFLLRRLEMQSGARVIWNEGGRCGVVFDECVEVDEWIAGSYRIGRSASFGQARVDSVQASLRAGSTATAQQPIASPAALHRRESDRLIGQEILLVKHMLDSISAELSENIEILMKHERALQNCDIASAILELVAKVVIADDRSSAIEKVNMHEVKARLSGRPTLS